MKKKYKNLLTGFLAVISASVVASCQVVTTGTTTAPVDVELSELERIMKKYDDLGYKYEYSGNPVEITMCHWDSAGASIEK